MSFTCKEFPPRIAVAKKEKTAISIKREMGPSSCYRAAGHTSTWSEKGTKKKKEIALRGHKSTGDPFYSHRKCLVFGSVWEQRTMEDSL
ncbi:hypothetical protein CEXT_615241 [Caerostris extrusa]|uniref:Uncharacterized protein n=1 Tax=Caerostris extrusa TaxID=172846 RepID=A0AAV4PRK4_CAEEX|nr:hypothetical protein CEXT_615241 [Caerostris extrusa]